MIEGVRPQVDAGRFPIKRVAGERVVVEADVFCDGHDVVRAVLGHRSAGEERFTETPMSPVGNDRFRAAFVPRELGRYEYTVCAWTDDT